MRDRTLKVKALEYIAKSKAAGNKLHSQLKYKFLTQLTQKELSDDHTGSKLTRSPDGCLTSKQNSTKRRSTQKNYQNCTQAKQITVSKQWHVNTNIISTISNGNGDNMINLRLKPELVLSSVR